MSMVTSAMEKSKGKRVLEDSWTYSLNLFFFFFQVEGHTERSDVDPKISAEVRFRQME